MLIKSWVLPLNPVPWAIGPVSVTNKGGTKRPFVAPNDQLVNYQEAVREYIKSTTKTVFIQRECQLNFYFWRRLDQYKTPTGRTHYQHAADTTNLQKGLEDALQGVLFVNDKLVRRIESEIVEQSPETNPGIIIILRAPYKPKYKEELDEQALLEFEQVRSNALKIDLDNVL